MESKFINMLIDSASVQEHNQLKFEVEDKLQVIYQIILLKQSLESKLGKIEVKGNPEIDCSSEYHDISFHLSYSIKQKYSSDELCNIISSCIGEKVENYMGRGGPYSFCYTPKFKGELWIGAYGLNNEK